MHYKINLNCELLITMLFYDIIDGPENLYALWKRKHSMPAAQSNQQRKMLIVNTAVVVLNTTHTC